MGEDSRRTVIHALPGWITAAVAIGTIFVAAGAIYDRVYFASEVNRRQDVSIGALEREMAVVKASMSRLEHDVGEIKHDVKVLLKRAD